jgi:hypothetical protein
VQRNVQRHGLGLGLRGDREAEAEAAAKDTVNRTHRRISLRCNEHAVSQGEFLFRQVDSQKLLTPIFTNVRREIVLREQGTIWNLGGVPLA